MEATCVTHIGICVRDMEKSLAFYRDALGMNFWETRPLTQRKAVDSTITNANERPGDA